MPSKNDRTCLTCHFRTSFNGKDYCSMSDSARTKVGLRRVKYSDRACLMWHKRMSLEECVRNATEFWKDVDSDEFLQELRGSIDDQINDYINTAKKNNEQHD